jgi:uncharacterized membrane protein YqiK
MNLQETTDHIKGLGKRLQDLRAEQAKFLAAQSIDTQIAKAQKEIRESKEFLEAEKKTLKDLKQKKSDTLEFTIISMEEKISEMLPTGSAVIRIEDGSLYMGWQLIDYLVRYESLSGGQKVMFEQALTRAMLEKGGVLVYEAAEVDADNMKGLMEAIKTVPYQTILNTWKRPKAMKDWTITPR